MSLQSAYIGLHADIYKAFIKVRDTAKADAVKGVDNSDKVIFVLSLELAQAIHAYVLQADVVTVGSGPVTGIAAPLAPAGVCPIVGVSSTSSTGKLI